jgi:hypothetical protein
MDGVPDPMIFNGRNIATGDYATPSLTAAELSRLARGLSPESE